LKEEKPKKLRKEKKTAGGFEVETKPVEAEVAEELVEEPEAEAPSEATQMVNEAVVEVSAKTLGRVLALLTKIPEMDFTEEEVEQLKQLWSPLIPTLSPLAAAIVGTTVILAGKVAVYTSLRKGKTNVEVAAEKQASPVSA